MGLPDVKVSIVDGGLGLLSGSNTGITCKVGVCSGGTINQIIPITETEQIPKLGTGPLADAVADSFVDGNRTIYTVRAAGDLDGTVGPVKAVKTGTGSVAVTGKPLDAYDVQIKINDGGKLNTATFSYSLDGGTTIIGKITVPAAGTYDITGTGLTIGFTPDAAAPDKSFLAGDVYTCRAEAPTASIASINAALDVLLHSNISYEGIHVVGPSAQSLWAALAVRAAEAESNYRYIYFVAETRGPAADENVDAWMAAMLKLAENYANTRVGIVAGRLALTDSLTGRVTERNGAGVFMGRVGRLKLQESAGKVILGSLPGIVELRPAGINPGHITALDAARFITFRQYEGLNGYYITDGRMMAESVSDFRYLESRRVMDKACRECRLAALRFLHSEADPEGIKALEAHLQHPLNIMIGDREMTAGRIVIPPGQDVLAASKLKAKIRIVPVGIMRTIELEIGFENPFLKGGATA